ncbi:MAG: MFS transporter, partial [Chloroflexota bacterium]|nr:MFS transporter [Chloroflexota bacterium]
RVLHNRDYSLLWTGQFGHSAALWVEAIARSWLIWELTGSATLLATVNLLRAMPMLFFGLFGGVLADRFDKRKILIVCQTVTLANYLVIATLVVTGTVQVWHVLLSAFVMGSSMSFNQPARTALVPSLVGDDELQSAVALNAAAMNVTRVVGPGVAGLLIAPLGISGVYYISAGVYVLTLVTTIMMRVPPVIARAEKTSMRTDMGETFRYVFKTKTVLALVLLALVPMVFGMPYMTVMPVLADEVLHVGASGFGWLQSAAGVGALLVVLLIAAMKRVPRTGLFTLVSIFAFGALLMAFSQCTWYPLSLVMIAFVGLTSTASRVFINTSLLETAAPEMRGRVMSVYTLDRGLIPLGTMVIGPLVDAVGAPLALLAMSGVCMLLPLIMGLVFPFVRRIP